MCNNENDLQLLTNEAVNKVARKMFRTEYRFTS